MVVSTDLYCCLYCDHHSAIKSTSLKTKKLYKTFDPLPTGPEGMKLHFIIIGR